MKKVLLIIFIGLVSSSYLKVLAQPLSGYLISKQSIPCNSASLGDVKVSGFGGVAPYWFELDGSGLFWPGDVDYNGDLILDKAFFNLTFGPHIIKVKDNEGTTYPIPFVISIDEFVIGIINVKNVECDGLDIGQITAKVANGGMIPIQWSIDGGGSWQGTGLFAGLADGPYTITAQDDLGCIATYDTIVLLGDESMIEVPLNNDVNCFGEANGSVEIITINGTAPTEYSMDLNFWQSSGVFSGLSAGTYTFYSIGSNSCISDTTFEVSQPDDLLINNLIVTNNTCFGESLGSIIFNVTGGNPGYSYELDGNSTAIPIDGLAAGTYQLIVTDTNGCDVSRNFTINDPEEIIINVNNSTNVTCFGGNDGSITVSATGGIGVIKYSIDGGPFQGAGFFNALNAGDHIILVEDETGCQVTRTVQLLEPTQITAVSIVNNPDCEITANGFINFINPGGGNGGPYSYTWSDDGSPFQPAVLPLIDLTPGNYIIRIYDMGGDCFTEYSIELIADSDLNIDSFDLVDAICGKSDGEVTINVSGGQPPYIYNLDGVDQNGNHVFTNISAGPHPVKVTDGAGCSFSTTVDVVEVTDMVIKLESVINEDCSNGDGEIEISVTGGTPGYVFTITGDPIPYPDPNGWTFTGLSADDYTITVTDVFDCKQTLVVTVEIISSYYFETSAVSCNGLDDGEITVWASTSDIDPPSPNAPYTFEISPNPGVLNGNGDFWTFDPLPPGTYEIILTDVNGCEQTISDIEISEPDPMSILAYPNDTIQLRCFGDVTLDSTDVLYNNLTISGFGGTPGYKYSVNGVLPFVPGNTGGALHQLIGYPAGTITVGIKDSKGCIYSTKLIIEEPQSPLDTSSINITHNSCIGDSVGVIEVNAIGGWGVYQYQIDGLTEWQESNEFTGLPPDSYTVNISDSLSCMVSYVVDIGITDPLAATSSILKHPNCDLASNGSVQIEITQGWMASPISLIIDGNPPGVLVDVNPYTVSGLVGGVHTFLLDNGVCTITLNDTLNSIDDLELKLISETPIECPLDSNGVIEFSRDGGISPYSYEIDGVPFAGPPMAIDLDLGLHIITVTDDVGCTYSLNEEVTTLSTLEGFASAVDALCFDVFSTGSVTIFATQGIAPFLIWEENDPGNAYIGGDHEFTDLPVGNYNFWISDAIGCEIIVPVSINELSGIDFDLSIINSPVCHGDSNAIVSINVTAGVQPYQYSFDNILYIPFPENSIVASILLPAGNQTIIVEAGNSCKSLDSIQITEPDTLLATIDYQVPNTCFGDSTALIEINPTGGVLEYEFSLNEDNFVTDSVFTDLPTGIYLYDVVDANGCIFSDSLLIDQPNPITFNAVITPVDCYNYESGSIEVFALGGISGYLYSLDSLTWNTDSVFDGIPAGDQSIFIIDNNDCIVDSVVHISQPDSIETVYSEINHITCAGFSNAAVQFDIFGGTPPYIGVFESDTLLGPVVTLDGLGKGDYQLSIYDGNNCLTKTLFTLNEPDTLEAEIEPIELLCFGDRNGVGIVNVSGGTGSYNYKWNNITGDKTATSQPNLAADISYIATIYETLDSTCFVHAEVIPTQPPQIKFILTPLSSSCDINNRGVLIELTTGGVEPFLFLAGSSDISEAVSEPYFTDLNDELTSFFVIDSTGCVEENLIAPYNPNIPKAWFVVDNTSLSFLDPLLNLTDQSSNHASIAWDFGDGTVLSGRLNESFNEPFTWGPVVSPTHEYQFPGDFEIQVMASSDFGCVDSSSRSIYIQSEDLIYIPNAFTPDGDGNNDIFNIKGSGLQSEGFSMQLYERRGRLVYQTVNIDQGWDGRDLKGSESPSTVYTYVVRVYSGDRLIEKSGSVLLIR